MTKKKAEKVWTVTCLTCALITITFFIVGCVHHNVLLTVFAPALPLYLIITAAKRLDKAVEKHKDYLHLMRHETYKELYGDKND